MNDTSQIVCLTHDNRFYYFISRDTWSHTTWRAESDAGESESLTPTTFSNKSWYVGSFLADRIVRVLPGPLSIVRWQLRDLAVRSERFPEFLSSDEMNNRCAHDDYECIERSLYTALTEQEPAQEEVIQGPWIMADGELPPDDGLTWIARLPYQLEQHAELRHLYPGRLTGFRSALVARLRELDGVEAYDQNGGFTVYIKTPYHPARRKWRGRLLASGKPSRKIGKEVEERLTRSVTINPPTDIHGVNRAEAVKSWDWIMADYVTQFTEAAAGPICGACDGSGIAPIASVKQTS